MCSRSRSASRPSSFVAGAAMPMRSATAVTMARLRGGRHRRRGERLAQLGMRVERLDERRRAAARSRSGRRACWRPRAALSRNAWRTCVSTSPSAPSPVHVAIASRVVVGGRHLARSAAAWRDEREIRGVVAQLALAPTAAAPRSRGASASSSRARSAAAALAIRSSSATISCGAPRSAARRFRRAGPSSSVDVRELRGRRAIQLRGIEQVLADLARRGRSRYAVNGARRK